MIECYECETLEERAQMAAASDKEQDADEHIPEKEINEWRMPEDEKGSAVVCHKATLCQRITEGNFVLAEMASPLKQ